MAKCKFLTPTIIAFAFAFCMSLSAVAQGTSDQSTAQGNTASSAQTGSNPDSTTAKHHHGMKGEKSASPMTDSQFLTKAAEGGKAEVELGNLALQKASSADVKQFAQRMVDDHTKANQQLEQVASKANITVPTSLNAKDQALKDKLSSLSGDQFDKAYMRNMVRDHRKDVHEFQMEANNGTNSDIKQFAQQTLPTLQEHLKQARSIAMNGKTAKTTATKE